MMNGVFGDSIMIHLKAGILSDVVHTNCLTLDNTINYIKVSP